MPKLELKSLTKCFGSTRALSELTLQSSAGECLVVLGPSGSGKSTLLRLIAGLESPTRGEICFNGQSVRRWLPRQRDVGMVFQDENLLPQLTVKENLELGARLRKHSKPQVAERVNEAAARLQLTRLLDRRPHELSGGERQRVAVGRLLVTRPAIWLLDEPLAHLDPSYQAELRGEIRRLQLETQTTMIYVTHHQQEAMMMGDQIAILRQGQLQQQGTPVEIYQHPTNCFVASFMGDPGMNLFAGSWSHGQLTTLGIKLNLNRSAGQPSVVCGLRPEAIRRKPASADYWTAGRFVGEAYLGPERVWTLQIDEERIRLRISDATEPNGAHTPEHPAVGQAIPIGFQANDLHLFSAESGRRLGDHPSGITA